MFTNLQELIKSMPDEKQCRDYVIKERWNGVIVCPYCSFERSYVIENGKRFKCANKSCYKKFSVLTGTIFQSSKISVFQWLTAIYLVSANKKGISSYQLAKHIGTSQKTSWFMLHRIREALKDESTALLGKSDIVEADMTHSGGKIYNMSNKKRAEVAQHRNNNFNKTSVLGITERNGRSILLALPQTYGKMIDATIKEKVEFAATVVTDEGPEFLRLTDNFHHHTVNHGKNEFARMQYHTNSIEGMFSHFKRMVIGTYHSLSEKHLQSYCNEFAYRYNTRKMKDAERFELTLKGIEKRLTYNRLVYGKESKKEIKQIPPENKD